MTVVAVTEISPENFLPKPLGLADVTLLTSNQEYAKILANGVHIETLKIFGMGLFHHAPTDSHWIGMTEPNVSDHDRWYYVTRQELPWQDRVWWKIYPEHVSTEVSRLGSWVMRHRINTTASAVYGQLRDLLKQTHAVNERRGYFDLPALSTRQVVMYQRLLAPVSNNVALLDAIMPNQVTDWQALHDAIYHHDAWARTNGLGDLPQALSLRMLGHGWLEPYLELLLHD